MLSITFQVIPTRATPPKIQAVFRAEPYLMREAWGAISGDLIMADALKALLPVEAKDYNQALSAAARDGHLPMTKWPFENGATNPNSPDGFGKTPLSVALAKGYTDVAEEIRRHGGTERI